MEAPRMDISKIAPGAYRHLVQMEMEIAAHVDGKLLHLAKLRASQINGCAFCIAMHSAEALRDGERPVRLTSLDAWDESPLYTPPERAVLRWVEEITLVADQRASKPAFDALRDHFSPEQIGWLTLAAVMINAWNRIAIASRAQFPDSGGARSDEGGD